MKQTDINRHTRFPAYGVALSSVVLAVSPASAAIVNLTFAVETVPFAPGYGYGQYLYDGSNSVGHFPAFNNNSGKTIGTTFGMSGWYSGPVPYGGAITFLNAVQRIAAWIPATASYTATFGFLTLGLQTGWVRISFKNRGTTTFLAAAYNDERYGSINAGQTAPLGAVIPESSTTIALAGLASLAMGVGVRKWRKRRSTKTA
ncbi:hypothetical protein [Cerasicoccus frondis]|uniref:hypothetical protein n=1 Tax=Cerasicoccus frondis TaxID=490090 RepID=UPI0028524B4B|nr:hypothetical protein [Cerasicoccus frondis]